MLSKQLYAYFQQWKQANEMYKHKLRTTVKDKVLKLYLSLLRVGFNQWHVNADGLKLNKQQSLVEDMQEDQGNL